MSEKNAAAVQLGRRGGKATCKKLTPEQRSAAARKAAHARWTKTSEIETDPRFPAMQNLSRSSRAVHHLGVIGSAVDASVLSAESVTPMPIGKRTREHQDWFLKELFARSGLNKQLFNKLCAAGCNAEHLAGLLFAVCTIAVHDRGRPIAVGDISSRELRRLPTSLRSLADLLERVNKTGLAPKIDLLSARPDLNRDPARKAMVRLYDMLPGTMRVYSCHLELFSGFKRTLLKRLTLIQLLTVDLLLYLAQCTGGPNYNNASQLLTEGFLVVGGSEISIPKFFSTEALAQLNRRTAKFRRIRVDDPTAT
jgi:hypothetical protein